MELTLVCNCGADGAWTGETFTEIRAQVEADGWDIKTPTCPEHTAATS
jgi:hypothetical protein